MPQLEEKLSKIKIQLREFREEKYQFKSYYFKNIIKILVGLEPSYVSPKNLLVNSGIYGIDDCEITSDGQVLSKYNRIKKARLENLTED